MAVHRRQCPPGDKWEPPQPFRHGCERLHGINRSRGRVAQVNSPGQLRFGVIFYFYVTISSTFNKTSSYRNWKEGWMDSHKTWLTLSKITISLLEQSHKLQAPPETAEWHKIQKATSSASTHKDTEWVSGDSQSQELGTPISTVCLYKTVMSRPCAYSTHACEARGQRSSLTPVNGTTLSALGPRSIRAWQQDDNNKKAFHRNSTCYPYRADMEGDRWPSQEFNIFWSASRSLSVSIQTSHGIFHNPDVTLYFILHTKPETRISAVICYNDWGTWMSNFTEVTSLDPTEKKI